MTNVLLQRRNLLGQGISQCISYHMRTIDIIMGVIFFTLWNLRILAWHKPHAKLSAAFDTHLGFNVVGNLGGIHEWNIQCLGYMAWSYDISSVGIYERITVDEFLAIILFVT